MEEGHARGSLATALALLDPRNDAESADRDRLFALPAEPSPWDRSAPLHLTASALVVHPPTGRVLLRWHERQQAWMQVGGHGDPGETDPLAIALREAEEETGLTDLRPWPDPERPRLLQAVIVPVGANADEPAHEHGDLRYLFATDDPDSATPENSDAPLQWLTVAEAIEVTNEDNVADFLRRIGNLLA